MTTQTTLCNTYTEHAYTHSYIFGFTFKGAVYAMFIDSPDLTTYTVLDTASRGAGKVIKFKPNTELKKAMVGSAQPLCSVNEFEAEVASTKYNRGEIFEKLITEMSGQIWEKDNKPFTEAPDIEINGKGYQIKFQKASFLSEAQAARLTA